LRPFFPLNFSARRADSSHDKRLFAGRSEAAGKRDFMLAIDELAQARSRSALAALSAKAVSTTPAPQTADGAAIVSISREVSLSELEKHLDDYKKGRPEMSAGTAGKLMDMDSNNALRLSESNPNLSSTYLAFRSGLSYEQKSRYVDSMNSAIDGYQRVTAAQSWTLPPEIQKLVDRYKQSVAEQNASRSHGKA
jgi:hypothetical protein